MRRLPLTWTLLFVATLEASLFSAQTTRVPPAREAYAELPGARIWFKDTGGSGTPVLLMHAATGTSQVWEHQIPAFTAAGYRVIAYDRRGWGRTVSEAVASDPGTAADDLQALTKYLRIDRFHLVGTAAGGIVSLDYALSFPDRVRSLVVANSIGGMQDPEYLELGRRLRPAEFNALPPDLRELGPSYRAGNPEGTRRWLELEKTSRPRGPLPPAQKMRNELTFALLEKLKLPTLFITGGADQYAPPPVMRLFVIRVQGSESLVVPDAGHSVYWEEPETFNRAILTFIGKH